jgi:hypothetical protein
MPEIPIEVAAAAAQLGLTRQALHHYISTGKLEAVRIGRMWAIYPQPWERFKTDYYAGRLDDRGRPKR